LLRESWTGRHGVNDEIDAVCVCNTDFEQIGRLIWADQHGEVVDLEHPDWVSVCVQHVFVCDPCLRALSRTTGSTPSSYLDMDVEWWHRRMMVLRFRTDY